MGLAGKEHAEVNLQHGKGTHVRGNVTEGKKKKWYGPVSKKVSEEQSYATVPKFSQDWQATSLKQRNFLIWGIIVFICIIIWWNSKE